MSIVIIGAGLAGGTAATELREQGYEGTVVLVGAETHPPYERPPLSKGYLLGNDSLEDAFVHPRDWYAEHDVDLRLGTSVAADDLAGADLVVAGVGVSPRLDLARSAGLAVDDGVLVDAGLRTSVASVYAVGDIASHAHPVLGRRIRVEHWDTAINQAKVAAHNLAGADETYDAMPYFFTDQYDWGMEYYGHASADDVDEVIVRRTPGSNLITALWVKGSKVLAGLHFNDWDAIKSIRHIVDSDAVDVDALRDPAIPLPIPAD